MVPGAEMPIVKPVQEVGERLLLLGRELIDAVEEEHAALRLPEDSVGPALGALDLSRGQAVGGKRLGGEAGNERPLGRRAGGVQGAGCQVAAGAFLAFDGRQGQMGRHALHLLNEPAHDWAASGEAVDAGVVLGRLGGHEGQ